MDLPIYRHYATRNELDVALHQQPPGLTRQDYWVGSTPEDLLRAFWRQGGGRELHLSPSWRIAILLWRGPDLQALFTH